MSVVLEAGDLRASFEPDVSMVGASLTHRGDELLGQRGGVEAYRERGKSMGVPLLHPWANRLGDWSYGQVTLEEDDPAVRRDGETGLPIHGLLHGRAAWEVVSADDVSLHARLDYGAHPEWLRGFPYPHVLDVRVTLDPGGLRHETTLTATGVIPVPVAFGWHPYLVLPGVPRADWIVEADLAERLVLTESKLPTGEVRFEPFEDGRLADRVLDEGFAGALGASMVLRGGGRRLSIGLLEGYTHAQVFAPADDDVVAFEPMTAPADALRSREGLRVVAPGESLRCAFRLGVS